MHARRFVRASAPALAAGLFACGGIAVFDDGATGGVGGVGSTGECPRLLEKFRNKVARATSCRSETSTCGDEVFDACGCVIPAMDPGKASEAREAYRLAFGGGCFVPCAGCTPSPGAACLEDDAGDFVCTPQR